LIPRAIEEVLRLQSAVQFFPSRSATADIEVGGTVIPKGSAVHLMYGAANRDPDRFANPTHFDPERKDNEHFGWGSGIHTCLGGPLARLEVNLAVENFLRRVENPRLVVDPPPYRQSQVFRGPRHLLVDFDPPSPSNDRRCRRSSVSGVANDLHNQLGVHAQFNTGHTTIVIPRPAVPIRPGTWLRASGLERARATRDRRVDIAVCRIRNR
jgi:hypothetical protein